MVPGPGGQGDQGGDQDDHQGSGGGLMRGLAQEVDEDRHGQDASPRSQGADDHADPHSDDEGEDGAHGRSPVVRAGVCAGPAGPPGPAVARLPVRAMISAGALPASRSRAMVRRSGRIRV